MNKTKTPPHGADIEGGMRYRNVMCTPCQGTVSAQEKDGAGREDRI